MFCTFVLRFRGRILNSVCFCLQFSWSEVFFSTIILSKPSWTAGHWVGGGGLQNILSITSTSTISLYCQGVGKVRQQLLRQAFWPLGKIRWRLADFSFVPFCCQVWEGRGAKNNMKWGIKKIALCIVHSYLEEMKIILWWSITIYFQK